MNKLMLLILFFPLAGFSAAPPKMFQSQFTTNPPAAIMTSPTTWSNSAVNGNAIIANGLINTTNSINGRLNAHSFGAFGNNTNDDTIALQTAINACQSQSPPATLYLSKGIYNISGTLTVTNSNFVIEGDGIQNSVLRVTGGTGPAILVYNSGVRLFDVHLRGFKVLGATGVMPDGVRFNNVSLCSVENMAFYFLSRGLIEDGIEIFYATDCTFNQNNVGAYLTRQTTGGFGYANLTATGCTWDHHTNACVLIDANSSGITLDKGWMESYNKAIWITNLTTTSVEVDHFKVSDFRFQQLTAFPSFLGAPVFYAEPSVVDNFIMNSANFQNISVFADTATTNVFVWKRGGTTGVSAAINFSIDGGSSFFSMPVGSSVIYSDDIGFDCSWGNNQILSAPKLSGFGSVALNASANAIKLVNTNDIAENLLYTSQNNLQIATFQTNSALGVWVRDPTKLFSVSVNESNAVDFYVYHGLTETVGNTVATGNSEIDGNLSVGTTYAGGRLNLVVDDFLLWRDDVIGNNPTSLKGTTNGLAIIAGGIERWSVLSNGVLQANGPGVITSTSGGDINLAPASGVVNASRVNSTNSYQINGVTAVNSAIYTNFISGVITQRIVITGGLVTSITTL